MYLRTDELYITGKKNHEEHIRGVKPKNILKQYLFVQIGKIYKN